MCKLEFLVVNMDQNETPLTTHNVDLNPILQTQKFIPNPSNGLAIS
jgi:hypothetical protein